jgi:hypothetical protein
MATPQEYGKKWSGEFYPESLRDHIHALGVVAANYNSLEMTFYSLFCEYFGISDSAAALFAQFKNNFRIDALKVVLDKYEADQKVADSVLHFLRCFNICADNRNILMHSLLEVYEQGPDHLLFRKSARHHPEQQIGLQFDLSAMREVADDIWTVEDYCRELYIFSITRRRDLSPDDESARTTLPEKPVLPNSLTRLLQPSGHGKAGPP